MFKFRVFQFSKNENYYIERLNQVYNRPKNKENLVSPSRNILQIVLHLKKKKHFTKDIIITGLSEDFIKGGLAIKL